MAGNAVLQRSQGRGMGNEGNGAGSGLQAAVAGSTPAVSAARLRNQMSQVESRVCLVFYPDIDGNQIQGTGFLIGPGLVLTNYHVVEDAISRKLAGAAIRVRFGYSVEAPTLVEDDGSDLTLAPAWLLASSPYAESDKTGAAPYPQSHELDYAVLQLAAEPGHDPVDIAASHTSLRGWFRLQACTSPVTLNDPIRIFQHPLGEPIKIADGVVLKLPADKDCAFRLRHSASTDYGSSGSPCLDSRYSCLLALHHAGDPLSAFARYNQAIPIGLIAADLRRQQKEALVEQPAVPRAVALNAGGAAATAPAAAAAPETAASAHAFALRRIGSLLFMARPKLRELLRQFVENDELSGNTVLITGPGASGKSHSWHLIRHIANLTAGVSPFRIDLAGRAVGERALADVYELLRQPLNLDAHPSPFVDGPQDARAAGRLLELLRKVLANIAARHWLVVDGLDDPATPDDTVVFFYRLGLAVINGDMDKLSVFLLGQLRSTGYEIELESLAYRDPLLPLGRAEFLACLKAEIKARNAVIADADAETIVTAALAGVGSPPTRPQMQAAVLFLRKAIDGTTPAAVMP